MLFFSREATSEIYGPRVYSLSYLPSRSILFAFIFTSIFPKTQKYLAALYFILHLFEIYLSNLSYFYPVNSTISGTITRKGLTTFNMSGCKYLFFVCRYHLHVLLGSLMTHKCRGSIVVLLISKSVEPNDE